MRMTSNVPSGSVIYGKGGIGNLAFSTPSIAGCSWEPPTSSRALEKSLRKPRSLGCPPQAIWPAIVVQETVLIGESAGLQGLA